MRFARIMSKASYVSIRYEFKSCHSGDPVKMAHLSMSDGQHYLVPKGARTKTKTEEQDTSQK